jgi:Flp pilus assembly pilin Flp
VPILPRMKRLSELRGSERGQTMAEYSVALTVITIAALAALGLLSGNVVDAMNRVAGFIG